MDKKHYWKWVFACGIGEFIGLGLAALVAIFHYTFLGDSDNTKSNFIQLIVMVTVGMMEGSIAGYFQWTILKKTYTSLKSGQWILWSAIGAGICWLIGMMPPLFYTSSGQESGTATEPSIITIIGISAIMGLFIGLIWGGFQYFAFRKVSENAERWIMANALAWIPGMVIIMLGTTLPNESSTKSDIILYAVFAGLLGGLSLGMVTGHFLRSITPNSIVFEQDLTDEEMEVDLTL